MSALVHRRRIEFSDTDLGGVVHHSRYFVFMENAEDEWLRSLGASFRFERDGRTGGWPKVAASCDYLAPLFYGDEIEVHLSIERVARTSVSYAYSIRRAGSEVARGKTVSVHCLKGSGGRFEPAPLPADLAAAFARAGA